MLKQEGPKHLVGILMKVFFLMVKDCVFVFKREFHLKQNHVAAFSFRNFCS